jgi:hypothetical protein
MPRRIARANGRKSVVRAAVEYVFAQQKGPMGLFIRTIGIARANNQDRPRQPRLQHEANGLAHRTDRARLIEAIAIQAGSRADTVRVGKRYHHQTIKHQSSRPKLRFLKVSSLLSSVVSSGTDAYSGLPAELPLTRVKGRILDNSCDDAVTMHG